jgi:glutamate/tyrosine decarboxylase-like PLP-dependent enzyme
MPLVAFCLTATASSMYSCFDIQDKLRSRGWIVPAYNCPNGAETFVIMRVVVKQNFTTHMADMLVDDILRAIAHLETHHAMLTAVKGAPVSGQINNFALALGHSTHHRKSGKKTHGVC